MEHASLTYPKTPHISILTFDIRQSQHIKGHNLQNPTILARDEVNTGGQHKHNEWYGWKIIIFQASFFHLFSHPIVPHFKLPTSRCQLPTAHLPIARYSLHFTLCRLDSYNRPTNQSSHCPPHRLLVAPHSPKKKNEKTPTMHQYSVRFGHKTTKRLFPTASLSVIQKTDENEETCTLNASKKSTNPPFPVVRVDSFPKNGGPCL